MTDDSPSRALSLLSWCAVLDVFDRATLAALAPPADTATALLLAGDQVLPADAELGTFQLREDARRAALEHLRADGPGTEQTMHERAFAHFLDRLRSAADLIGRAFVEQRCFYHLDALRAPLIEHHAWSRIRAYVAAVRAAEPRLRRHEHLLSLYDGMDAIRTQRYEAGEATLATLLAEPDLAPDLRMRALNVLAQSYWFRTRYDRALELYQEVHALADVVGNRVFAGHALLNQSLVYHEIGMYAQAQAFSIRSLEVYRAQGDMVHAAHALYEIAKNAMHRGRWQEAETYFRESAAAYERIGMQAQLANVFTLQATLALALGDDSGCETLLQRGLAIARSPEHGDLAVTMDGWLLLGLLYQTQERWHEALGAYDRALEQAQSLHNTHYLAIAHFRRGTVLKAQALDHSALIAYREAIGLLESLRDTTLLEDVKLGMLGVAQQFYEAAVLLLLERGQPEEAYHTMERARSRALLDMLARKMPELYATFDQPVVTLAEVQARLPAGATLVEYYTTGVLPAGEHLTHQLQNPRLLQLLTLPPHILIFVITHEQCAVRMAPIDPNLLRSCEEASHSVRRWLRDRQLRALYDALLGPIADLIGGCRQLFLIPHGPLHHVPFLALRAPTGSYLIEADGPVIAFAPSATLLLRNCLAHAPATSGAFLALGYNDPHATLHHAEGEARSVARLTGGMAWTGPDAKTDALADITSDLRGLHIAGHAVYRTKDPLDSHIVLGADDRLTARMVMERLNLRASLVTLSACTSGLSRVAPGDELLGLLRSWLYAGASTVVCTLWDAADITARLMMEQFYARLQEGASPGVAFRDAVVATREISGRELADIFVGWRAIDPETLLPEISADIYDKRPYADPQVWAPFMLIGRP